MAKKADRSGMKKSEYPLEHVEHANFVEWCEGPVWNERKKGPKPLQGFALKVPEIRMAHCIPNGAKIPKVRNKQGKLWCPEIMKLKREGLTTGVPDWFWPFPVFRTTVNRPAGDEKLKWTIQDPKTLIPLYYVYGHAGLYIEFKRQRGYYGKSQSCWDRAVSDEQKAFIEYLNSVGYVAKVAYGCEEAIKIVEEYLR
jgi:hypothetical protein